MLRTNQEMKPLNRQPFCWSEIVNLIDYLKQIPDNTLQECFLLFFFPVDRFWKLKLHFMIKWHKEKLKVGCNFLQYLK